MKKREKISWITTGLLATLISTFSPIINGHIKVLIAKNEHAEKTIQNLSSYYNESISYQYDEQGNYVKIIETKSREVEILKEKEQKKDKTIDQLKYERDSLELRKIDIIPRLKTKKIKKL